MVVCADNHRRVRGPAPSGSSNTSGTNGSPVLDGGVRAWEAAGQPLTHKATPPKAGAYRYEAVASVVRELVGDVATAIDDPATVILDNPERRGSGTGRTPGAPRAAARCRVRCTSKWLHNVDGEGRMLDADTLRERYAGMGITTGTPVNRLLQHRLPLRARLSGAAPDRGIRDVRNYVASWQEWGNRMECPIVVHGETLNGGTKPPHGASGDR